MDSQKFKFIIIMVLAAFAALYLGIAAAQAQVEAIAWMLGILALATIIGLGKHVWVLIPILLQLSGNINLLPGNPPPWWGGTMAVFAVFTLRFLMHKHDFKLRLTWLEIGILLQAVAIGQAFLRNPTGLSILGGDIVGGRPYIVFGFAFVAYFLLSLVKTDLRIIKCVVLCMVAISLVDGGLALASVFLPSLAIAVIPIYGGVSFDAALTGQQAIDTADARLMGSRSLGKALGVAAFTLFRPISTANPLKPIGFLMMISAVTLILLSGFRSILFYIAVIGVVSSLVRRKPIDVFVAGAVALMLITGLVVTNSTQKLPFGAQRILSVLPVDVRSDARATAENSSTWRFEMWRLALTTDRYISNKLLGDGFAFRSDELAAIRDTQFGDHRRSRGFDGQEAMMAKGSYHGFHVETIRMTGAFGLLCALIGLGIFFRYAWLQIQHFRGRREWPFILYICIPFLIHPFYLMLIFGAYRDGFPLILVAAGMLKLLDNIRHKELAEACVVATNPEIPKS